MPSAVLDATPSEVLPFYLAAAFTEELDHQVLSNSYPDGSSERWQLAQNPRRFFKLTLPLQPTQWSALWDFYTRNVAKPFYYYAPRETAPPFSWDATGQNPIGRYTVVFDGNWTEEARFTRAQVSIALREVA